MDWRATSVEERMSPVPSSIWMLSLWSMSGCALIMSDKDSSLMTKRGEEVFLLALTLLYFRSRWKSEFKLRSKLSLPLRLAEEEDAPPKVDGEKAAVKCKEDASTIDVAAVENLIFGCYSLL